MSEPDPLEALLAGVLDAEPIMEDPNLDPGLMSAFTSDVAEDIDPPENVAKRYGFRDGHHMIDFIAKNRGVRKVIKAKRAIATSNASIEVVNRKKANFVIGEAMATMAAPMFDPKVPATTRLDTFKAFSRMAGIDGVAAAAPGAQGQGGTMFSVSFNFSGAPMQTITTVVDAQAEPADLMPQLGPMPDYIAAVRPALEPPPEPEPEPEEVGPNRPGLAGFALRDFHTQGVAK